jgi:hypothetical protein
MMPPSYPASAVSPFAYGILFGMGVIAGTRVRGFWKRMLLLVPALAAMILSEAIVPRLAGASSHSMESYAYGFFFGVFLMVPPASCGGAGRAFQSRSLGSTPFSDPTAGPE